MQRRAFTLIELLVVMAIISILAGLLMPALVAAQKQAWSTSCQSRLRQIGHAVTMYSINSADCLPGCGDYTGTQFFGLLKGFADPVDFSAGYMSPYVEGDRDVWQCPAFAEFMPRADGPCTGYAYNYAYLTDLITAGNWWDPDYKYWWRGKKAGIITKYTTTVLFGDSATNWMGPLEENWFWTPPSQGLPWGDSYTHFRHRGQANVLWADGHVASLFPDKCVPLDRDNLGVICDESDLYYKPQ